MPSVKVAVTGAAGQIGYALIFSIAQGRMFGPDVEVELQLLELPACMERLKGVAMELQDGAYPLLKGVVCTSDLEMAMKDVNWAILVGAMPRGPGMVRADLLKANGPIFVAQGSAINDHAAPDVRVFVVGNPCNTNCLITMCNAPRVPRDRFYAMTTLDELRGRAQLAEKAQVPVTAVANLTVWGNHSKTQFPDYRNATIHGRPVMETITDEHWLRSTLIPLVQGRGAAVIAAKGSSSAASAANAIVMGIYNLTHDTPPGQRYSVARCSEGEYGVPQGVIFSYPCRTVQGGCQIVPGIEHDVFAQENIGETVKELQGERATVEAEGLLVPAVADAAVLRV